MKYFVKDLKEKVLSFEEKHDPNGRYASYDYCYNHFHPSNNTDISIDMEKSCLALGFYLASWGMYRGSSFMLEKSARNLITLVEYIASQPTSAWEIDVNKYTPENIDFLIEQYNNIRRVLIKGNNAHLTLTTKIMIGVFSSVPAYDRFFIKTFKELFKGRCGFTSFNKQSLKCIESFYNDNQAIIQEISTTSKTVDFNSGRQTCLRYSNAKIIDMYGFTKGL